MSHGNLPLPLDPLRLPLRGRLVIEASAGTGKTWTLAALYVRLVLGHPGHAVTLESPVQADALADALPPLAPPNILVMTFTEAATAELRDRIRARLALAARAFRHEALPAGETWLLQLRDDFAPALREACAQRLEAAAQWMDEAAITTIHGWCSRMLRSHAFDSASLFTQNRAEDSEALRQQSLHDYWRQWYYPLSREAVLALGPLGRNPQALASQVRTLWAQMERSPVMQQALTQAPLRPPARLLAQKQEWIDELRRLQALALEQAAEAEAPLRQAIAAKRLKGYQQGWAQALWDSLRGPGLDQPDKKTKDAALKRLRRFSRSQLQSLGWEQATQHACFDTLEALAAQLEAEPDVQTELVLHAAVQVQGAWQSAKRERAEFDFSDLLQSMYHAVRAPDGRLARTLREQYPVALVDEFQDTDPWQYGTLSHIYADEVPPASNTALVMIGDPKQAIYRFRGADLDTYLQARQQAHALYTLDANYRSTPELVRAVNHVFEQAPEPFGAVPFSPVQPRASVTVPDALQGHSALTVWTLPDLGAGERNRKELFWALAQSFASRMVALLHSGAAQPSDMAVLVRSGKQAAIMRTALAQRGVRSVYLSENDSVYASEQAQDVWRILRAIAQPARADWLRVALSTRLWGRALDDVQRLQHDEAAWDALTERLQGWHALWQRQGLLPMLYRWMHDESIAQRLLQQDSGHATGPVRSGERALTNLLHLADLLQVAEGSLQGEAALIRYLEQQLLLEGRAAAGSDTAQMRLESDASLVKIVTIHKSKGLEYPLVFVPFAPDFSTQHDAPLPEALNKLLPPNAVDRADPAERDLQEGVRLLYVALTRARLAVWIGWATLDKDLTGDTPKLRSPLSRLLGRRTPDDLHERLSVWQRCPDILVQPLPAPDAQRYVDRTAPAELVGALPCTRHGYARWWSASFSALTRGMTRETSEQPPQEAVHSARDERRLDDQWDAAATGPVSEQVSGWNAFPAGSRYGTLLHDLLEWQFNQGWPIVQDPRTAPEPMPENAAPLQRQWQALLEQQARRLALDASQLHMVEQWLRQLASTAIAHHGADAEAGARLRLADLGEHNAWAEMGFSLPVRGLSASRIDQLLRTYLWPGQPRPALQPAHLQGMLVGFMDLVLQWQGRYCVMDYKSNRLERYNPEALQANLLEHRYDVQLSLYLLALHRLLRTRLPDYDPRHHLGGAVYWYARGIDAPGAGVVWVQPPVELILALDDAFTDAAPSASPPPPPPPNATGEAA